MTQFRPAEILLVEDNVPDIEITREALLKCKIKNNFSVVMNGEDALDFVYKKGKYSQAASPDIILLDLNLPGKDGREVLERIKSDPVLRVIPVVVLTSSKAEEDIIKTYSMHANCYVTKPLDFEQFSKIVQSIETFWFSIVSLPNGKLVKNNSSE